MPVKSIIFKGGARPIPPPDVIDSLVHDHDRANGRHVAGMLARRPYLFSSVLRPIGPVAGEERGHERR